MTPVDPPPLTIPDEAADLAADALRGYPIAEVDLDDAGIEVLQAAGPAIVAAELRRLVDFLLREEVRTVHACVRVLERRADELDLGGAR